MGGVAGLRQLGCAVEIEEWHAGCSDLHAKDSMLRYVPFSNRAPDRRVVIAWRKSFTRHAAIEAIRQAVLDCNLAGVTMLDVEAVAQ